MIPGKSYAKDRPQRPYRAENRTNPSAATAGSLRSARLVRQRAFRREIRAYEAAIRLPVGSYPISLQGAES